MGKEREGNGEGGEVEGRGRKKGDERNATERRRHPIFYLDRHLCISRPYSKYCSTAGLYKPLAKVMQILTHHISITTEPVLIKLKTIRTAIRRPCTNHAKPYLDATTWVVLANTQLATGRVLVFFWFLSGAYSRTSGPILTI